MLEQAEWGGMFRVYKKQLAGHKLRCLGLGVVACFRMLPDCRLEAFQGKGIAKSCDAGLGRAGWLFSTAQLETLVSTAHGQWLRSEEAHNSMV
jgi:hypothetical protein